MEEIASFWSYQEDIDELKQRLLYTTLELEAVKAETDESIKRNNESIKQLLQLLKLACHERDEARNQLQKLLKIMPSNDPQIFGPTNPSGTSCFMSKQAQNLGPSIIPVKANSSVTESNSLSDAYNHTSSTVDSFFDPISSPEFSNINVETQMVQDYPKMDQTSLVMEDMIKGQSLPQKGKLLQTVLDAGPLLQTLLVAGPLPRWRNPPPIQSFPIPPMLAGVNQPYTETSCGSSSQMMAATGGGIVVLGYGDGNCQGRMVAGWHGASNFSTIGKRQRLH